MFQISKFPCRYYQLLSRQRQLLVFDKPGGKVKHSISLDELIFAYTHLNLASEFRTAKITDTLDLPTDFSYAFAIFTENSEKNMLLWAATEKERNRWISALNSFIEEDSFDSMD